LDAEPVGRGLARNVDQPAVTRGEVQRQARDVVLARGTEWKLRAIRIDGCLQADQVRVLFVVDLDADAHLRGECHAPEIGVAESADRARREAAALEVVDHVLRHADRDAVDGLGVVRLV